MYYEHFGFQSPPFSISPDPRFLYLSERHRDALAHLIYGAGENGGFVLLTGQVGTGKTTLIRSLLSQELANVDIALCLHSGLSVTDFVASILDELNIVYAPNPASLKPLVDALNAYLLRAHAAGRQTVLIIDEGQNLSREVLEQVRLLTNLETDSQKLLRIILVGQEELQDIINRPDLRQLSQRITGRYHLTALNADEVKEYIAHRIKTAKGNPSIFSSAAIRQVYRLTGGVPRLINVLCDRAFLVAYNADTYRVTPKHIKIAAVETIPTRQQSDNRTVAAHSASSMPSWLLLPLAIATLCTVVYGGYRYLETLTQPINSVIQPTVIEKETVSKVIASQVEEAPTLEYLKDVSRETSKTVAPIRPIATTNAPTSLEINREQIIVNSDAQLDEIATKSLPQTVVERTADIKNQPKTDTLKAAVGIPEFLRLPEPIMSASAVAPLVTTNVVPEEGLSKLSKTMVMTSSHEAPIIEVGVSQTEGVRQLLKRWGLQDGIPAQQTACDFAKVQQMQCLVTRAGLPLIRVINRPVLLELQDNGTVSWLPIVGIDSNQQLICLQNDTAQRCDNAAITRYWSGSLLVLLREPNVSVQINPGFEGEQIQWLRQRIAIAESRDISSIDRSLSFDKTLVEKVRRFQQSRYIKDDGIIGHDTLLYLFNVVADENTPLLFAEEY